MQRDYSEDLSRIIDEEVRALMDVAHDEAWEVLTQYRHVLDRLVIDRDGDLEMDVEIG